MLQEEYATLIDKVGRRIDLRSKPAQYALWFFLFGGDSVDAAEAKRKAAIFAGYAEKPTRSKISRIHNDREVKEALNIVTEEMADLLADKDMGLPYLFSRALGCMSTALDLLESKLAAMKAGREEVSYHWLKLAGDYFDKITRLSGNAAPEKIDISATVTHKLEDYFSDTTADYSQAARTVGNNTRH